jgi:tetratricopeptide (TPR) repeat protein
MQPDSDNALFAQPHGRLDSWKAIARHLDREVRTVQRWERAEQLPVHRLQHEKRGSVYALTHELDHWMAARTRGPTASTPARRWLTVGCAILLGASSVVGWSLLPPTPAPRIDPVLAEELLDVPQSVRDIYWRGVYHLQRGSAADNQAALDEFQAVLQAAPRFAAAHARWAEALTAITLARSTSGDLSSARAAAETALDLDPRLAQAHVAMAEVLAYAEWNWGEAEREWRRALQLDPYSADAHADYAQSLAFHGHHEEAIAQARRALELEPLSATSQSSLAWYYYWGRHYDDATALARKVLRDEPGFAAAQAVIVHAMLAQSRWDEARLALLSQVHEQSSASELASILNQGDARTGVMRYYAARLSALQAQAKKTDVRASARALPLAILGEESALVECLREGVRRHDPIVFVAAVDPLFDAYRESSAFAEVLSSVPVDPASPHVAWTSEAR